MYPYIPQLTVMPITHLTYVPISQLSVVPITHLTYVPIPQLTVVPITHLSHTTINHCAHNTLNLCTHTTVNRCARTTGSKNLGTEVAGQQHQRSREAPSVRGWPGRLLQVRRRQRPRCRRLCDGDRVRLHDTHGPEEKERRRRRRGEEPGRKG